MVWRRFVLLGLVLFACATGWAVSQDIAQPEGKKKDGKDPAPVVDAPLDTSKDDERTLKTVGMPADGPAMLDYFKKRTLPEVDPKAVAQLVKDLADDDFATREKAFTALALLGPAATNGLKDAEGNPDAELRKRIADLKIRIDTKAEPAIQAAAARLLAKLKPAGTTEILLAYLPFATDAYVVDEICKTLGALALVGGQVDPLLVKALDDPTPIKRSAAGEALIRSGDKEQAAVARKLLKDADPKVRLRVCVALVPTKDKTLLPIMIELLGELPAEMLWPIEEVLIRLAAEKSPSVPLGADAAGRKAARDAWQAWYAKNEATIDLTDLERPETMQGFTLYVQQHNRANVGFPQGGPRSGEVVELKPDKSVHWRFNMPSYPVDAIVMGPDRVVVADYQSGKITERDFKGNVINERTVVGNPVGLQKLPNGNLFIITQNRLVEMRRDGAEVFSHPRPEHDIVRGRKLRSGEVVFITTSGLVTRIDGASKQVRGTFNIQPMPVLFGGIDILPGGNLLVAEFQQNRVVEYTKDGKQAGAPIVVQWPNSATRLPNGHTLVASQNSRKITEFDRNGREVWAFNTEGTVFNARRR